MQAVMQVAIGTIVVLLVLLAMPDPITKFVAAWATVGLIPWVGAKTLYKLVTGWFQLMQEVKRATTFEQIREAGERFGKLFSRQAAQAFATLAAVLERATGQSWRCRTRAPPSALAVGAC
jgi:hypothetical protein